MNQPDHVRNDRGSGKLGDRRVGRREEQISRQYGYISTASGEDGGNPAPKHRAIMKVVVDQRGVVQKFHRCSDDNSIIVRQPHPNSGVESELGSHPLAARC